MDHEDETPDSSNYSVISPYGYQTGSCGYCKDENSSVAYYAKTSSLTVEHYQELADRGWRRSGTLLYKPDPKRSCCPHYTIRLPVKELKPTKSQRQALNRWNRFVLGEKYLAEDAKKPRWYLKNPKVNRNNEFDLVRVVHESEWGNHNLSFDPDHDFGVLLERDDFSHEKFKLYEKYQRLIHKEEPWQISVQGFRRFLCSSPLVRSHKTWDGGYRELGSFHQCYRLNGRLIAMGVLDLLPQSVSSVYFIYDPEFEQYSFGRISALREAALAIESHLDFYYMGYYIHSCTKMRYKIDLKPQYVLDAETNEYSHFDEEFKAKLDQQKYISLFREKDIKEQETTEDGSSQAAHDEFSSPLDAAGSGLSLFDLKLAGITPIDQLKSHVDFSQIPMVITYKGEKRVIPIESLVNWEKGSYNDPRSIKGTVADLAAAVGPNVANEMIVDFTG